MGFHLGIPTRATASALGLAIALLIGMVNYLTPVDGRAPRADGLQLYCMAANLYQFGRVSTDCETAAASAADLEPSMRREPFLSALLAPTFAFLRSPSDARSCATSAAAHCAELRVQQRQILGLLFVALIVLVYAAARDVTGSRGTAAAAALCAAFGNGLIAHAHDFYTELHAALLLLVVSWMSYRVIAGRRPLGSGLVCGAALGLLVLTKAVFLYLIPVLALLTLVLIFSRSYRYVAVGCLAAVLVASVIGGSWMYRNQQLFGRLAIAGRDGNVMAIRAQFAKMTWSQYWTGYLVFTPVIGERLARALGRAPADLAMFDGDNPQGFIQRYRRGEGDVALPKDADQDAMKQQSITALVRNWPMNLALSPLLAYRGAFMPIGFYRLHDTDSSGSVWSKINTGVSLLVIVFMFPAFLGNLIIDALGRRLAYLAFHLPALYAISIHAVATHYTPRYSLPLFGVMTIELCVAAWRLTRRLSRRTQ